MEEAGIPRKIRQVLLGHNNGDIITYHSTVELYELIEAAEKLPNLQY